jgi:hypothetical protein
MRADDGKGIRFINEASLTGLIDRDIEIAIAQPTDQILDQLNAIEKIAPGSAVSIACSALAWQVVIAGRCTVVKAIDGVRRIVGALTAEEHPT